jgi:phosphoribosylaminoimidazole-succinocarboxamide synthase
MFYDTYTSLYNWYYGISIDNGNKEEVVTRVIEMDEDGEVLDDNIINTTTDGEQIIPTISISEIKTIAEGTDAEGTEADAEAEAENTKTISEYVKQYVVETNYRLRGKKKSLLTKG